MTNYPASIQALGWNDFLDAQLTREERDIAAAARVVESRRAHLLVQGERGEDHFKITKVLVDAESGESPTVGDWILLRKKNGKPLRALTPFSKIRRLAAGLEPRSQPMAANVDTLFIVTSCNRDFNPNRLERYIALAFGSGVEPVLVLTKADLADDAEEYCKEARKLHPDLPVVAVDTRNPESVEPLRQWCCAEKTIVQFGSSGVGKSTLLNTLAGQEIQLTGEIRETDEKGRHTTTARSLHLLPDGALLIDCPGMRELQLLDCAEGVRKAFSEIAEVAAGCRFTDCKHDTEPDCAVREALDKGLLDPRRVENYAKLLEEQQRNTDILAEQRKQENRHSKHIRSVQTQARHRNRKQKK